MTSQLVEHHFHRPDNSPVRIAADLHQSFRGPRGAIAYAEEAASLPDHGFRAVYQQAADILRVASRERLGRAAAGAVASQGETKQMSDGRWALGADNLCFCS